MQRIRWSFSLALIFVDLTARERTLLPASAAKAQAASTCPQWLGARKCRGIAAKPGHSPASGQRQSHAPTSNSLLAAGPLPSMLGDTDSKGK